MRTITRRYVDPLDEVWLAAAASLGLSVRRTRHAYASTDGAGTLDIADPSSLDPDDCLAQMIFHEICHSLVEGPGAFESTDWGLDNASERDVGREHACLRVQAYLSDRYGLRRVLAPTTDFRSYYDALPDDPFEPRRAPEVVAAILAAQRAALSPWFPHVDLALEATRNIVDAAAPYAGEGSLLQVVDPLPVRHPSSLPGSPRPHAGSCGSCAWRDDSGTCHHANFAVDLTWPACERYETILDCTECGACCREAYHSVTIEADDPVTVRHPQLIVVRETYTELVRDGDRCAALRGGQDSTSPYGCAIYDDRPGTCRDFERGGQNCLVARRRVGLTI